MKCRRCGADVRGDWEFCPRCGARISGDMFSDMFSRMERELKEMGKMFERDFEVFDLSPFFRKPLRGRGFSIKITQSSGEKPKVSVKTFGNVNREEIEKEVRKLGFRDRLKGIKPKIMEVGQAKGGAHMSEAKTTEEPKTCVRRLGDNIVVEVKLPDVKDEGDIEVNSLENSIEVKAMAGDKAYFKILTKPPQTGILRKSFKKGILYLELG